MYPDSTEIAIREPRGTHAIEHALPHRIDSSEGPVPQLGTILRRYRTAIGLTMILSIAGALFYSALQTPLYRAKTVIAVEGVNPEFLGSREIAPTSGNSQTPESYASTETKLLKSDALAQRVVAVTKLQDRDDFFLESHLKTEILRRLGRAKKQEGPRSIRATAGLLQSRMTARTDGDSNLIIVTIDAPKPELAAELAHTLTTEFEQQEQESRWSSAARVGTWLTSQLEDFRRKLELSEQQLQQYADSQDLLYAQGTNVAEDKLRQVQQELSKAQAERIDRQAQLNLVTGTDAEALPRVLDDSSLRDLNARKQDLQRQMADLLVTLTPTHYKVDRLKAQLAEIDTAMEQQRRNIVTRMKNEYQAAVDREKLLQDNYAAQARQVSTQSSRAIRYNTLKGEAESNRTLYTSMLQKVKEASVLSAVRTNSIRVVDPAQPPDRLYSPNYLQGTGIGLLAGLILSGVLVLLFERTDATIKEPGEMRARLHIRELGAIPSAGRDVRISANIGRRALEWKSSPESKALAPAQTWSETKSLVAEAFRSAAASLLFACKSGPQSKVILITSPLVGTGKTTTTVNLAAVLASGGRRVAVVDGDLRKPRVHELLSLPNHRGLADLLAQPAKLQARDFSEALRPTGPRGIVVLTAGSPDQFDPGVLESPRMADVFNYLRQQFDLVLVDSPPTLHLSDARIIARLADAVVLVGRAGQTRVMELSDALQQFHDDGRRVIGSILNDWDPRATNPHYYRSYYSQYGSV